MAYNPQDYYSLIAQAMGGTNPDVAPVNAGDPAEGEQVPPYVLEALRAQQQAQSQGPMDQAMAPQAPQGPMGAAMAPQAPQGPSMMDRFQARGDKNSIYDGLINGGAALLGAKNLKEGLADGVTGFNNAYDAKTDKDRELNQPKVTPLADGAFSLLQFANGTQKVVKNADVAQFLNQQKLDATTAAIMKLQASAGFQQQGKVDTENRAKADKAKAGLDSINEAITKFDAAGPAIERYGNAHRAAAATGSIGGAIAGAIDPQVAIDNQQIGELNVQGILEHIKQLPGSASDKDVALLSQNVPAKGADPAVVKDWYARNKEALHRVAQKYSDQVVNAQGGATQPTAPAPATASTAPAINSQADYAALPSGSLFRAPDGSTRRKP